QVSCLPLPSVLPPPGDTYPALMWFTCVSLSALRTERQMASFSEQMSQIAQQIQWLLPVSPPRNPVPAVAPSTPTPPPSGFASLTPPERFSGDSGDCHPFLTQCGLHFELQPARFPTDRAEVAFIISRLSGRAEVWATAEWAPHSTICDSLQAFSNTLVQIFQQTRPGREAARSLMELRQGGRRVADYAIEFRTLATDSEWNPVALFDAFIHGLSEQLKDQLAPLELPPTLEELIALTIKIDNRLFDREMERLRATLAVPRQRAKPRDPTATHLSSPSPTGTSPPVERERRMRLGECLYCGQRGHLVRECQLRPKRLRLRD
uniref:CCHC-type domain-containing protein n=1 Tax=Lates calcarifer TaxID=8187 RepID=A0A4W6DS42_LATCA